MSQVSQYAKIPCILATTAALHIANTSPTATPPKNEHVTLTAGNRYLRLTTWSIPLIKGTFWAVGFAEIASILANHSLSPAATKTLAATIMKIGAEKNLRLTYLSITGMLFIVGGGLIRLQCYRTLKKFFTFEVAIRENHELVTTGPYGVVRHPSYAGTLSHYIGMFFWFGTRGSWLRESGVLETTKGKVFFGLFGSMYSMVVAALLMRMSEEDKLLKKSFGKKWEEWAQRVPYCIIPGIY